MLNPPQQPDIAAFFTGPAVPADPTEHGISDVVLVGATATTFRVAFYPYFGSSYSYPFNASLGPGYVWHCHILDHEVRRSFLSPLIY